MGGLSFHPKAFGGVKMTVTTNREIATVVGHHIGDLRAATVEDRQYIIEKIIVLLYSHFANWAPTFCRINGDIGGNHRDDVVSVVAERVLCILRESTEPGKHENVDNWYSYLYASGRYASLAYFNSSKVTPSSGMVSVVRKQRHIARVKEVLRGRLGREPDHQEVMDAANADMRSRRSNPEKQGVLVDLSDLKVIIPTADVANHDRAIVTDEQALLAPVEGRELIKLIVESCGEISPELGRAAHSWIGNMYSEPPSLGTAADIALALDISTAKASRLLSSARDTARDLCSRRFGISFPA